jgi:predicted phosphodiesterase
MKKIAAWFLLLFLALPVIAQEGNLPASVRQACGPYLQNVTDTSFTVIWTTNMDAVSWVEVAPDDGTNWNNTARPKYYDLRGFGRRPIAKVHHVTVKGLEPDTKYRYRIMMEGVTGQYDRVGISYSPGYGLDVISHPTSVRTKARSYDRLHIAMVNDLHEGDSVFRRLFSDAKQQQYDFVVFNGDMTTDIANEKDLVKHYLKSAAELFGSSTPIYATRGNHEYRGNDALKWMDYWETPTGKTYFSVCYGKFFFIFLDSGEDKYDGDIRNLGIMITDQYTDEEAAWLKEVVGSEAFRHAEVRIVFSHMQPDPKGWFGNAVVANKFVPILNRAGIDLMLCGHIHNYKLYEVGTTNARFPVVCNKNRELMTLDVDKNNIRLKFFDPDHKLLRSLDIKTRQY